MQLLVRERRLIFQRGSSGQPEKPKPKEKPKTGEKLQKLQNEILEKMSPEERRFYEYIETEMRIANLPRNRKTLDAAQNSDEKIRAIRDIQQESSIRYVLKLLGVETSEDLAFVIQPAEKEGDDKFRFTISTLPDYSFRTWGEPEDSQKQHFALYDGDGKELGVVVFDNRGRGVEVE